MGSPGLTWLTWAPLGSPVLTWARLYLAICLYLAIAYRLCLVPSAYMPVCRLRPHPCLSPIIAYCLLPFAYLPIFGYLSIFGYCLLPLPSA